jgi:hypothetical protein
MARERGELLDCQPDRLGARAGVGPESLVENILLRARGRVTKMKLRNVAVIAMLAGSARTLANGA